MKSIYYLVLLIVVVLPGCSQTTPKSCLGGDPYPPPQSLCTPAGSLKVASATSLASSSRNTTGKQPFAQVLLSLIDSNPDIGIAGAKEKEQYAGIKVAEAAGRPTFDVSVSGGPQRIIWPDPAGDAVRKEASANLRQVLYDFGAIKNDVKRAEMTYQSATSARIAKTEDVAFDMVDAFMKVREADDLIRVTRDNIAAHQAILNLVQLREQNGNGTVADIKRITTRLESAKSALIDLTTKRADAASAFENLTSVKVDTIDGSALKGLKGEPDKIDTAVLDGNPSIVSLQQEISALEYQLASTKAAKLPVFGLQGTVRASQSVSSPENDDNQLAAYGLVTMRFSVFDGGLNDGQQAQIKSRLDAARLKLEKQRRSLWEDTQNATRVTSTDGARSGSIEVRVAAAKKVADLNLEQFKNGAKSVFELMDGQADYFKAKGDLVEQTHNRTRAQIKALQLRGQLVRTLLGLAPTDTAPILAAKDDSPANGQYVATLPGVKVRY